MKSLSFMLRGDVKWWDHKNEVTDNISLTAWKELIYNYLSDSGLLGALAIYIMEELEWYICYQYDGNIEVYFTYYVCQNRRLMLKLVHVSTITIKDNVLMLTPERTAYGCDWVPPENMVFDMSDPSVNSKLLAHISNLCYNIDTISVESARERHVLDTLRGCFASWGNAATNV